VALHFVLLSVVAYVTMHIGGVILFGDEWVPPVER
ncbi:MAG: hypothetical protein JWO38_7127, partial [Gemmataceae bacterium]|nr:hypothetical protein [Gemmataceae bacterium]